MKTYLVTLERTVTEKTTIEISAADKKTALFAAHPLLETATWSRPEIVPFKVKAIEQKPEPVFELVGTVKAAESAATPVTDPAKRKVRSV